MHEMATKQVAMDDMNRGGEKSMATDCTKQPNKTGFGMSNWQRTAQNGQTRGGASAATRSIL
jgi:hypothetical protein